MKNGGVSSELLPTPPEWEVLAVTLIESWHRVSRAEVRDQLFAELFAEFAALFCRKSARNGTDTERDRVFQMITPYDLYFGDPVDDASRTLEVLLLLVFSPTSVDAGEDDRVIADIPESHIYHPFD